MFKRIGATILTVVMLLSMTSVYSLAAESAETKMGLEVSLTNSDGETLNSVMRGEEIQAVVKIKNPIPIRGIAVGGINIFEDTPFELAGEPIDETNNKFYHFDHTSTSDSVLATWMANNVVQLEDDDVLMTVPLKVKQDADLSNATISFQITDVYIQGEGGESEPLDDGEGYNTESAETSILIIEGTRLSVSADKESVQIGEKVTVEVDVGNYKNNWATMTILGKYDAKKFDLIETKYQKLGQGLTEEPVVIDDIDGAVAVTWFGTGNLVLDENDPTVLTLTFKAMTGEGATADFEFFFDPEGNLDTDGNKVGGFNIEHESDTVTLLPLPAEPKTKLSVEVANTAYVGKQVHVRVNVENYKNLWSGMTIQGTYDPNLVSISEDDIVPSTFGRDAGIVDQASDGQFSVSWANSGAVEEDATFKALDLVFYVKQDGAANFEFSITGVKDDNGDDAPASWYDTTSASSSITLEKPFTKLEVSDPSRDYVKVGDQVTYTVSLNGYLDDWLAMAIEVGYDPGVLEIADNGVKPLIGGNGFVGDTDSEGTVHAVWVYSEAMKLGFTHDVLQLTFNVVGEGDTTVFFGFKEDGIIAVDLEGAVKEPMEGSYTTDPVEKELDLFLAPSLEIDGETSVDTGDEYTVELKLNDYKNNWSSFGVEFEYDATVFEIEDPAKIVVPSFGGVDPNNVDANTPGKIRLDWSNTENITVGADNTILTVTFRAKDRKENGENPVFNANLVGVIDGTTGEVDSYEYNPAEPLEVKIKKPHLSLEVVPSMNEGETGELKIYLNEYTNKWNSIPVVLTFDPDLIRIKEEWIDCNELGGIPGVKVLRADDGMIVLTWLNTETITAEGDKIELATIPFKAHKDGNAKFDAYFEEHNLYMCNPQGGYSPVQADTYVADAEPKTVTIVDQYENMAVPMSLTVETINPAIKGKKETLTLKLDNFNPRVGALSVKLFYDKDKVTITDIQDMLDDGKYIAGVPALNEEEGYVHFIWVSSGKVMANESNPTIATLCYTATELGEISFHAEFVQVIDNNKKAMDPEWDYGVCGETTTVEVKEIPSMSVAVENTDVIKIGDTVTVTVSVEDYLDRWSDMTINGSYDKNLLRLVSVTPTDKFGNMSSQIAEGSFKATLSNNATNVIAGSDFDAITLVFKVIDSGNEGKASIDISFGEILTNGTTPLIPNADYLVNAKGADEINIQVCKHDWSKIAHKAGTSGAASKHILTCAKGCGVSKEEACAIETTTIKPNCTMAGSIIYKCSLCGYNETLTDPNAPALGHKFDGKPVHKPGTGKHVYTCTRGCGATKEENCTNKTQVVQPTCVTDGYTIYTCTVCNYSYNSDIVKAKGEHSALTLHYIAPTASTNGSIITQCDICKEYVVPPYVGAVRKTLKAGHPFPDVQDPASWYYKEVIFNKAFDIFGGDEKGNFNPTSNITRGQLVTVLGRIMKAEAEKTMSAAEFNKFLDDQTSKVSGMKSASGFTDLGGKYYERYAKLFAKWGIVNGYPDGTFRGDKKITREEMATLIKRFIEAYRGSTQNITFGNAATFKDFAKVSDWAKGNVEWVGKVGLFQGNTEKNYNPKSNATRAEIAVVIYRMLPVLKNICVCSLNH